MADEKYYQAELDNKSLFQLWREVSPEVVKNYGSFLRYMEETWGIKVQEKGNIMQVACYNNTRFCCALNGMLHEAPMGYCNQQLLKKYDFKEVKHFNE